MYIYSDQVCSLTPTYPEAFPVQQITRNLYLLISTNTNSCKLLINGGSHSRVSKLISRDIMLELVLL